MQKYYRNYKEYDQYSNDAGDDYYDENEVNEFEEYEQAYEEFKRINHWQTENNDDSLYKRIGKVEMKFCIKNPRPHILLEPSDGALMYDYNKLLRDPDDVIRSMISLSLNEFGSQKTDVILSLHTGSEANVDKMRMHLCLNSNVYIKLFEKSNIEIKDQTLPNKGRYWSVNNSGTLKEHYIRSVKLFIAHKRNHHRYVKSEDINKIRDNVSMEIDSLPNLSEEVDYYTHSSHPKIGFQFNDKARYYDQSSKLFEIFRQMVIFAAHYNCFTPGNRSHICLYIKNTNDPNLIGYVFMPANQYYYVLDESERTDWLNNFEIDEEFVPLT